MDIDDKKLLIDIEEDNYKKDLKWLLDSEQGYRFFSKFFKDTKVFDETFTGNSQTYYNEGRRSVGLKYVRDCKKANPEVFLNIWTEILEGKE